MHIVHLLSYSTGSFSSIFQLENKLFNIYLIINKLFFFFLACTVILLKLVLVFLTISCYFLFKYGFLAHLITGWKNLVFKFIRKTYEIG